MSWPGYPPQPGPPGPGHPLPAFAAPAAEKAWHQRWWAIGGVVLSVLLVGCVLGGTLAVVTSSGDGGAAGPGTGDEPGVAVPPPGQPEHDAPDALGPGQERTGSGPAIVTLDLPSDQLHIITLTHTGDGVFHARLLDRNSEFSRGLASTNGEFTGTYPTELRGYGDPGAVDITDGDSWTLRIDELSEAPLWPDQTEGTGPAVLLVDPEAGVSTVSVTHDGEANVFVWGHVEGEYEDLMVNEIGAGSWEAGLRTGTFAIEVDADGAWTIQPA